MIEKPTYTFFESIWKPPIPNNSQHRGGRRREVLEGVQQDVVQHYVVECKYLRVTHFMHK